MKKKTLFFLFSFFVFPVYLMDKQLSCSREFSFPFSVYISSDPPVFPSEIMVITFGSFKYLETKKKTIKQKKGKVRKTKRRHINHTIKKPFVCRGNNCIRSFARIYGLQKHMQKNHPELLRLIKTYYQDLRPYTCHNTSCNWAFNDPAHLKVHEETVHSSPKFKCCRCKKLFKQKCSLNVHTQRCRC